MKTITELKEEIQKLIDFFNTNSIKNKSLLDNLEKTFFKPRNIIPSDKSLVDYVKGIQPKNSDNKKEIQPENLGDKKLKNETTVDSIFNYFGSFFTSSSIDIPIFEFDYNEKNDNDEDQHYQYHLQMISELLQTAKELSNTSVMVDNIHRPITNDKIKEELEKKYQERAKEDIISKPLNHNISIGDFNIPLKVDGTSFSFATIEQCAKDWFRNKGIMYIDKELISDLDKNDGLLKCSGSFGKNEEKSLRKFWDKHIFSKITLEQDKIPLRTYLASCAHQGGLFACLKGTLMTAAIKDVLMPKMNDSKIYFSVKNNNEIIMREEFEITQMLGMNKEGEPINAVDGKAVKDLKELSNQVIMTASCTLSLSVENGKVACKILEIESNKSFDVTVEELKNKIEKNIAKISDAFNDKVMPQLNKIYNALDFDFDPKCNQEHVAFIHSMK